MNTASSGHLSANGNSSSKGNGSLRHRNRALNYGWAPLPLAVLLDRGLSDRAVRLYALLLSYTRCMPGQLKEPAFPGQERLSKQLGVNVRTIQRTIDELQDRGLLRVVRRGLTHTNQYILLDPDLSRMDIYEGGSDEDGEGGPDDIPERNGRPYKQSRHDRIVVSRIDNPVAPVIPGSDVVAETDTVSSSNTTTLSHQLIVVEVDAEEVEEEQESVVCTDSPKAGAASPPAYARPRNPTPTPQRAKATQPPTPPARRSPREPTAWESEHQEFFRAVCACCAIDPEVLQEGDPVLSSMGTLVQYVRKQGGTPQDLDAFRAFWERDWPDATLPAPRQVMQTWRKFQESKPKRSSMVQQASPEERERLRREAAEREHDASLRRTAEALAGKGKWGDTAEEAFAYLKAAEATEAQAKAQARAARGGMPCYS